MTGKMSSLPKERVTFFFSDIEGSTQLIQELGENYAVVLGQYHRVIRYALALHHGDEIDTAGDGLFAVFEKAADAVAAASRVQQAFAVQDWATAIDFHVRIGIHTGEAVAAPSGYIGLEVHRASRICNAARGGQVLLSGAALEALEGHIPEGIDGIKDLGPYDLRGFEQPEHLYQLILPGLENDFAPSPTGNTQLPSVAVLPFSNLSGDREQDYFCDGMAEEIIIALSKIPELRVVSRSSSFALRDRHLDVQEIGRRLHSKAVLEGSVRKTNGQLRISTELVEVDTGYSLWSGKFDSKPADIFSVQDEIARSIATTLKVKLISKRFRDIQSIQTGNFRAYEHYLHGRQDFYQFSPASIERARQLFQEAIEQDDTYALAYCGLANCYAYKFMYLDNRDEYLIAAGQASRRAIDLDPLLPEAYVAYGQALSLEKRYAEAEAAFRKALDLDSRLFEARYLFARLFFAQGKLEEAAHWFEEANLARPEDYQSLLLAGQVYDDLGKTSKANAARRRGVEIAESSLLLNPTDTRALYLGANGLVALGEKEKGLQWLRRALRLQPEDPMVLYNAGCIYALLGMTNEALNCLESAFEQGITQRGWFENDSNLDPLRDNPRFKALLEKLP